MAPKPATGHDAGAVSPTSRVQKPSSYSLIHTGIVYRSQVLEAIFVITRGKCAKYLKPLNLKPSQARAISSVVFVFVFVNLHCETEDATNTTPSRRNANWRNVAS
jgi:hypothetical protein